MAVGLLDRTPPAFFRQGTSALTKLCFCWALAMLMMVADARFQVIGPLRAAVATVLQPVERVLAVPVIAWREGGSYLSGLEQARAAESEARRNLAALSDRAYRVEQLDAENVRLRALLELRPRLAVRSKSAEVLYQSADLYSRKVVIDRGEQHGIVAGSPVVNEAGVLGQVTRAYPLSAEVTLLTDRDAAIPVLNSRTQVRSAAFGGSTGAGKQGMELRYMASDADVQPGDLLTTSGIDGVYPPGLPVAAIVAVDRVIDSGFARVHLRPLATGDSVRHVLVLEPTGVQLPPPPPQTTPQVAPRLLPARNKKAGR